MPLPGGQQGRVCSLWQNYFLRLGRCVLEREEFDRGDSEKSQGSFSELPAGGDDGLPWHT